MSDPSQFSVSEPLGIKVLWDKLGQTWHFSLEEKKMENMKILLINNASNE